MPKQILLKKHLAQVGTIEPYGGGTIPDDYLLCDGFIVNIADYPELFEVIGTSWGYGNNDGLTFHLPDLRGKFLRGVDKDGNGIPSVTPNDPDRDIRTPNNTGGNAGNNVGTDQEDKTKIADDPFTSDSQGNHRHRVYTSYGNHSNGPDPAFEPLNTGVGRTNIFSTFNGTHTHQVTSGGDAETRPINSAAMFMIKYRIKEV